MMDRSPAKPYEVVIGLEVHVQLATKSKLFCRCRTTFGAPPNTQTCPVCLGMPGSLPVMNRRAFELSLLTALALNCRIPRFTKWDRKQYYYPDLPKGYQISQYDLPMSEHGHLTIRDPKGRFDQKNVGITRAHLEEDAGKSMHDERSGAGDSRIDLNRTGTPLLEIVSEPDMRSPLEAKTYLNELKLLLTYLGVSDCNMQEGSLRVDANINLHVASEEGPVATPIVEVKNMNSFRAVERALAYEAQRQYDEFLETGQRLGDVPKQTRGWDDQAQMTRGQRSKEESADYRYFPDPDLAPVVVTDEQLEQANKQLGTLPAALRRQLQETYGLPHYDADVLVNQGRQVVEFFFEVVATGADAKRASNWIQRDIARFLKETGSSITQLPIVPTQLAEMLRMVERGKLDSSRAVDVLAHMLEHGHDAPAAMESLGIEQLGADQLRGLCEQLLAANPKVVEDVRSGKQQAIGALIGQAKKKNPNVNPALVRQMCLQIIEQSDG